MVQGKLWPNRSYGQTVQTLIRQLLQELSDLGLHSLQKNVESHLHEDGKTVNVEESRAYQSPLQTYVIRLRPGQEIVTCLQEVVRQNHLDAAFVLTCVGSVTKAILRMADSVTIKTYDKDSYEIVSLVGTLSAGGHLHGCFSDAEGHVFGGHVVGDLQVYTTAEIVIGNCGQLMFTREMDDQSGYKELVVRDK